MLAFFSESHNYWYWHDTLKKKCTAHKKHRTHEIRKRAANGGKSASVCRSCIGDCIKQLDVYLYAEWLTTVCHVDSFSSLCLLQLGETIFCLLPLPLLLREWLLSIEKRSDNRPIVPFCRWFSRRYTEFANVFRMRSKVCALVTM